MDYIRHNKEEHSEFKKLIRKVEKAKGDKKKELFIKLYGHHNGEEAVVFPAVKEKVSGEDLDVVLEMIEEHKLGNYQFSVLERTSIDNETWDAKFTVLKEVLEHHMDEEEEEFAKIAKKALSKEERKELLEEFEKVSSKKEKEKQKDLK
ncbi:MAG: hemerythrin domain-containing protein [Gallicola sp.]|nr:hemerythrin domain-containing protein [Gallicola sp.]